MQDAMIAHPSLVLVIVIDSLVIVISNIQSLC